MKVVVPLIAALALAFAFSIGLGSTKSAPALAQPPLHPHVLMLHVELSFPDADTLVLEGFHRCIDLAAGRSLPLRAHHSGLHTGTAGEALLFNAGHAVIPGAPLTDWANCAEFEAALPITFDMSEE
jgi:hypothetical protein